jgi:hypothetical protein
MNTPKFNELLEKVLFNLQEKKLTNVSYTFNDIKAGQLDNNERERRVWEIGFKEGEGLSSGELLDLLTNRTGLKVSAILRILDNLENQGVVETSEGSSEKDLEDIESSDDEELPHPDYEEGENPFDIEDQDEYYESVETLEEAKKQKTNPWAIAKAMAKKKGYGPKKEEKIVKAIKKSLKK